jgi:hypothetical protein
VTYSTPDSFAANLKPGGTVTRADEPKAFRAKGMEWTDHDLVVYVQPGSLAEDHRHEIYYRSPYWVFGGGWFPKYQMLMGNILRDMSADGFDGTLYPDKTVRAQPRGRPVVWTDLVMDDFGSSFESYSEGDISFLQFAQLQFIVGGYIKATKRINSMAGPFSGVDFFPYDPMHRPAYKRVPPFKLHKCIRKAQDMLKARAQHPQQLTHKNELASVAGSMNNTAPSTQLECFVYPVVANLWDNKSYPSSSWTRRGDPCFTKNARSHRPLAVNWMPHAANWDDIPTYVALNDESIECIETFCREAMDRNWALIYTGLPLQGSWQGQVEQSNEELMALPRGEFHTKEGIPFFATDATMDIGAQVTGREVATVTFLDEEQIARRKELARNRASQALNKVMDGVKHIGHYHVMMTEHRALVMGMVHSQHDILPPSYARTRVGIPTVRSIESEQQRRETTMQWSTLPHARQQQIIADESLAAIRQIAEVKTEDVIEQPASARWRQTPRRTDRAFLAAGRALGLVDNAAVVAGWNCGWSTSAALRRDIRAGRDEMRRLNMNLRLRYISTKINIADLPTRGQMAPFTQCIWFSDEMWIYMAIELGLIFTAEAYADEQNARTPRWCSLYDPFEDAILASRCWLVNMPWTDTEQAADILVRAYDRGERFDFGFVLALAPSIPVRTRDRVRAKIRKIGATDLIIFKRGSVIFTAKGTQYADDCYQLPDFRLFDRDCKPIPWDVELWLTPNAKQAP